MMIKTIAFTAMLAMTASQQGASADALNPDPLSVYKAFCAARNVGNVDAAMGFFTDNAELWDSRGRKRGGTVGIRNWIEGNTKDNLHCTVGPASRVEGNNIYDIAETNIPYFDSLGINPVTIGKLVTVNGNKLVAYRPYFPLFTVKRIADKCEEGAKKENLIMGAPCAVFAGRLAASTQSLIDAGEVPNE